MASRCHACGTSPAKLLLCGRCRNAWFCNRDCQAVSRKELGHRGASCRPADGAQREAPSRARAAPTRPSTVEAQLAQRFEDLLAEAIQAQMKNTRIGHLAAADKAKEAAAVADLIGGAAGSVGRTHADLLRSSCLFSLGNMAAAARVACSALRVARAAGIPSLLVTSLSRCGQLAQSVPDEMATAERESREQERRSGSLPHDGPNLSPEGRISLPTTPLAYHEAVVETCDNALAAAGGRHSPAAAGLLGVVPSLLEEGEARGDLGYCLQHFHGQRERGTELLRQAVTLIRRVDPAHDRNALKSLAKWLYNLGAMLTGPDKMDGTAEAVAIMREALTLSEQTEMVVVKQMVLHYLSNMSGRPNSPVGLAEATAFCSRLNALYAQAGRNPDTSCTICLEPLEQSNGGAEQDATGDGGRDADGYTNSAVHVLPCAHQFHRGCLSSWLRTQRVVVCPLCRE